MTFVDVCRDPQCSRRFLDIHMLNTDWRRFVPTPPLGPGVKKRQLVIDEKPVSAKKRIENEENTCTSAVKYEDHRTTKADLIKYFNRILVLIGCEKEMLIVSRAWSFLIRALRGNSPSAEETVLLGEEMPSKKVPPSLRAMVVACISLGIEVSGDFEGEYIASSAAWGNFFNLELTQDSFDYRQVGQVALDCGKTESYCYDLMRLKLVVSAGLDWDLLSPTAADTFAILLSNLIDNRSPECDLCESLSINRAKIVGYASPILNAFCFYWLSEGVHPEVIALMAVMVVHETFRSRGTWNSSLVNKLRRALTITHNFTESNGMSECVLSLAGRCFKNASSLMKARDLVVSNTASILELVSLYYPALLPRGGTRVLQSIDASYQSLIDTEASYCKLE